MSPKPKVIVGLGELLWDMLPEGKQLGGAPANFSVMSARLGNRAVIASRIGNDRSVAKRANISPRSPPISAPSRWTQSIPPAPSA